MPQEQAKAAMVPCRQAPRLPQPLYCRQLGKAAALTIMAMKLAALSSTSFQHLIRALPRSLCLVLRSLPGAKQQSSSSGNSLHSTGHAHLSRAPTRDGQTLVTSAGGH